MADRKDPEMRERVSDETKDFERADARQTASADRPPTPQEERMADEHATPKESVSAAYKEQAERGANTRGEGRIEP